MDKMPQEKRQLLVGTHLRAEDPECFARLLRCAAKGLDPEEATRTPLNPKNAKSRVWEYFNGQPDFTYCRDCCPPEAPESQ